jgi:glyoxylase-like metal-dependent hydrolase (beta-lactamase superfamily II)
VADVDGLVEIAPGLLRWTARHPEWRPGAEPGSPADWPPDVGSVLYEAPGALVLIDPLLPQPPERVLDELDARVRAHGRPVHVLTTIGFHRRSRDELARRYDAATSRAKAALPEGVETVQIRRAGETMVWLPGERTLVSGDRLLGDGRGGLRLPPASWLRYLQNGTDLDRLRTALRPLLELPVERVLVSHGEPVLADGRAAIERALTA